jgi:glycosyltransferase involved in cell wall biosynthesis
LKIAVVIPWFGRELKGGAEQHAWQVASRLAGRGHAVEVLTTCCRSHQDDWAANHFPEDRSTEPEGFKVRRFFVDPRNRREFDRVCGYLLSLDPASLCPGVSPISPADSHIFTTELIKSARLLDFIRTRKEDFDAFIFLPYLYGLILEGIRIVGRTAAWQPCLHDEAYAYLPQVAEAFRTVGSLLFISEGEQELALRLFGPGIWSKSTLVGAGVESPSAREAAAPSPANGTVRGDKFLLYLGRKDTGKNVPLLLNAFARFRNVRPNSRLRLILAGHGKVDLNGCRNAAVDLGLVSEEEKQKLLRDCSVLVQPSQNESFSRVMMEAWFHGKPVASHARCLATAVAVERSGGGWMADDESDWARLLTEIDRLPAPVLAELGANGRRYVQGMANWDLVIDRYETALDQHSSHQLLTPAPAPNRKEINQFLPNLSYGDAISNQALQIRDRLRSLGFKSDIFARFIDPLVARECKVFSPEMLGASAAIIYHHSIGTEITGHIIGYTGPKCLIYHNITPSEFFAPYSPEFAELLREGRLELFRLAPHFPHSYGVSAYNAAELQQCGFVRPGVFPLGVDPAKWNCAPDSDLLASLQDGRKNILFVGRVAPNKKQDDLIRAFHWYLKLDPHARLILAGTCGDTDPYAGHLRSIISALRLDKSVIVTGNVSDTQLAAYYRSAHLYWSMSEHEGFGAPLIEAMWFDVPVLAYRSSAIPETLGAASFMFTNKEDFLVLASLAHLLIEDRDVRRKIVLAQRKQRSAYTSEKFNDRFCDLVKQMQLSNS